MKRVLKFLAQLYPLEWRTRYGAEYEALLEQGKPRVRDAFDVLWGAVKMWVTSWSFARVVLPCAIAGALVAFGISFAVPRSYVSEATFDARSQFQNGACQEPSNLPEGLRGPNPAVCDDTATFDRFLTLLRQGILSRYFLESEIERRGLYARERARKPLDSVIAEMQRSIQVKPTANPGRDHLFVVAFNYPDPRVAQLVDQDLARHGPGSRWFTTNVHPNSRLEVRMGASLPAVPAGLSRTWLVTIGLFTGVLGGVLLATLIGSRPLRRVR
ncbi:MAG TPA: hypothetical protein VHU44_16925 [Acidobacteriaceae bacterium]|jgi:hypothetical protein|nr:hypothetical protein [Acidobacteriaceae bacterium]